MNMRNSISTAFTALLLVATGCAYSVESSEESPAIDQPTMHIQNALNPPVPGCHGHEFGDLYPDPDNCEMFYHCEFANSNGDVQAQHKYCALRDATGNRLHWNDEIKVCDWPEAAGCEGGGTVDTSCGLDDEVFCLQTCLSIGHLGGTCSLTGDCTCIP